MLAKTLKRLLSIGGFEGQCQVKFITVPLQMNYGTCGKKATEKRMGQWICDDCLALMKPSGL